MVFHSLGSSLSFILLQKSEACCRDVWRKSHPNTLPYRTSEPTPGWTEDRLWPCFTNKVLPQISADQNLVQLCWWNPAPVCLSVKVGLSPGKYVLSRSRSVLVSPSQSHQLKHQWKHRSINILFQNQNPAGPGSSWSFEVCSHLMNHWEQLEHSLHWSFFN